MQLYGEFDEKGYRFRASIPQKADEGQAFLVELLHADALLHAFRVPMEWEPRFGVDHADARRLEAITAAIIKFLPEPAQFGPAVIERINATVADMS